MIRLQERLAVAASAAFRDMPEPELRVLKGHVKSLQAMLGGAGAGSGVSNDRIQAEVLKFRETGKLHNVRSARLVCWGTRLGDRTQPPLIEDGDRFKPLLAEVDGFRIMPRPYRRCWRGLLDGYVNYDPGNAQGNGDHNWRLLREYLNDNLPVLERAGQTPDWLDTIDEHSNLLTDDPCTRYGAELLTGEGDPLEVLRRELSAGDSSWIGKRIFEAQIDAAVRFDDGKVRDVLPRVITLIGEHDVLADRGLARVLDRYADCSSIEVEPALCETSVGRWGNPWLERNDTQWTRVRPDTRKMVSSWHKLRLIEDFFNLLSADGINDQRRINFWKRHVDQITDMHFALGDAAYRDPRPGFKTLRQMMKGRLLSLTSGGVSSNNAFIMRIGGHVFVEFGEEGNAMFAFDAAKLPFDLSKHQVAGNKSALKHPSNVARIIHKDGVGERWERKADRLISRLSAAPARTSSAASYSARPSSTSAPSSPPARSAPTFRRPVSDAELFAFFAKHGIKSADSRDKGGSLWAYAPRFGPATSELTQRNFAWAERRGAWYLRS
ncbi:EH signature domain-containing protein [Novosphingobium sp. BW1]|uniref:EH signature domain-containing protein n=1 Tax=Novosphingobium sp. BW1 TaxID=2592621 RepID=UPI001396B45F|nr:EH signature domain-containing protein [Novosphingobium sp. BW1]